MALITAFMFLVFMLGMLFIVMLLIIDLLVSVLFVVLVLVFVVLVVVFVFLFPQVFVVLVVVGLFLAVLVPVLVWIAQPSHWPKKLWSNEAKRVDVLFPFLLHSSNVAQLPHCPRKLRGKETEWVGTPSFAFELLYPLHSSHRPR
jgi:hypothetical protein